jgi:hypothetical protein
MASEDVYRRPGLNSDVYMVHLRRLNISRPRRILLVQTAAHILHTRLQREFGTGVWCVECARMVVLVEYDVERERNPVIGNFNECVLSVITIYVRCN